MPSLLLYLKRIIFSSGSKILFLSTNSFTLSFSSFSNCSRDLLLISSVKAASYINSKGVSFSFWRSSDHLVWASTLSNPFHSGLTNDPTGALTYLGLFFFSPSPSSPSLSAYLFLAFSLTTLISTFFSSLLLLLLSAALYISSYCSFPSSTSSFWSSK